MQCYEKQGIWLWAGICCSSEYGSSVGCFDRVYAIDILWNVVQPSSSYNYYGVYNSRYAVGIWPPEVYVDKLPKLLKEEIRHESGGFFSGNIITKLGDFGAKETSSSSLADIFVWRNGIYVVIVLLFLTMNCVEKRNIKSVPMIPAVMTLCTLALAASWQIYQYYWFFMLAVVMYSLWMIVVVDPTFLIEKEQWNELADALQINKPYILVYQLVPSKKLTHFVNKMKKETGLPVVYVMFPMGEFVKGKYKLGLGPEKWLGYIKNAEYVITDSFHGVAFSIIFQKQFWVVLTQLSTRIENILGKLGLEQRIVRDINEVTVEPINYGIVEPKLVTLIDNSEEVLKKCLE